jgi:hypothetical protein
VKSKKQQLLAHYANISSSEDDSETDPVLSSSLAAVEAIQMPVSSLKFD